MALLEVTQVKHLPKFSGGFIFNTPEFQSLKSGKHLNFVLKDDSIAIVRIWFKIEGGVAISGYHATFGSIDSDSSSNNDSLDFFLKEVIKILKEAGVKEVLIKHWPDIYNAEIDHSFFTNIGFKIKEKNVNQHLLINSEYYNKRVKRNEKKKLAQSYKQGFDFKILQLHELDIVYQLIKDTRDRKSYPVSMSYQDLYNAVDLMPDKYLLFGLFDQNRLIAASVSIRISDDILYNFYHADDISYRSSSPLVMLVGEIYDYCQRNNIKILDLGVSSENGILNEGLFNFKSNLGCKTSDKNTYYLMNE